MEKKIDQMDLSITVHVFLSMINHSLLIDSKFDDVHVAFFHNPFPPESLRLLDFTFQLGVLNSC